MFSLAPLEKGSKMEELVTKIRVRKGLKVCRSWFIDGLHAEERWIARNPTSGHLLRQTLILMLTERCTRSFLNLHFLACETLL